MDLFGYNLKDDSDCDEVIELNDRFIRRYIDVMDRYGMLPECGEVLYEQVKKEFPQRFVDYLDGVNYFIGFNYLAPPSSFEGIGNPDWQWEASAAEVVPQIPPEEMAKREEQLEASADRDIFKYADVYYRGILEALIRQILDWCNIYGVGLKPDARQEGMQILCLLGHLLGLCRTSMAACEDYTFRMAIKLVEQGLKEISRIELLIEQLQRKMPALTALIRGRHSAIEDVRKCLLLFKDGCQKKEQSIDGL